MDSRVGSILINFDWIKNPTPVGILVPNEIRMFTKNCKNAFNK